MGPFEILEWIGSVTYHLALSCIHDVFHVSVSRKYIYEDSHIIDWDALQVESNGQIALELIHTLAR